MINLAKDFLRVCGFIFLVYIPLNILNFSFDIKNIEKSENDFRISRLDNARKNLNNLLDAGRFLEACQLLTSEHLARTLTAFSLKSKDETCLNDKLDNEFLTEPKDNVILPIQIGDEIRYVAYGRLSEFNYTLVTNKYIFPWFNFSDAKMVEAFQWAILRDLLSNIYAVFIFAILSVLVFSKTLQSKFRGSKEEPGWYKITQKLFGWLSLGDLQIVKSALNAQIKKHEEVLKDHELLETSLEHSILNHIKKTNEKLPYKFIGAVVKVDINGFSTVVSSGHTNESQSLSLNLEEFGCELLKRYKGLFEKTVGDEIVVVFQTKDAIRLACSFARDLMTEFSELDFKIDHQTRKFTLKSAIHLSEITFSKRPSGFGFFGNALTYSTRLLESIKNRDRNMLSILKEHALDLQNLVYIPNELTSFEFKNMTQQQGYFIDQFISFDEVYQRNPSAIWFFRSDKDLIKMLEKLKIESDPQKIDMMLFTMNDTQTSKVSQELIDQFMITLKVFEKRTLENPKLAFAFSKFIVDGSRLIPNHQWTKDCTDAVISISRFIEGRINASVVDVLIEKDLNQIAVEHEKTFILEKDQSFRTRGNLLISEAKIKLSEDIFDRVIKMVRSNNKMESATGIYCACRIIIDSRKSNPAELETFISYRKLTKILDDLQKTRPEQVSDRLLNLLEQVNTYNDLTY